MYSIGEFSKIGQVSTKTLRYYDEIGLLHPDFVDQETHYRYYSQEQVRYILFIGELKRYDLRLEQIKAIIESNNKTLLEHFLQQRIQEINGQMQESTRLKETIEKKMKQIQLGGSIMEMKEKLVVEEKIFTPVLVMSETATIQIANVGTIIGKVYENIFKNGLKPAGPVIIFYLDEDFNPEHAAVEVCVPVENSTKAAGIKGVKNLNPGKCAMCTYKGAYSNLGEAYAAVLNWIEENHYTISSAPFDCYMNNPQDVKEIGELITKVYFPIKK